ncbi:MAG TPA: branched-chain amino acid ABC transporter permease [Acetobacteraceae bacterium]|jgi:branched-chain amino acid transport system permease protein|nr:branched-chain amino acid ABC transporter permease [Acetobacteraceae bacterium]
MNFRVLSGDTPGHPVAAVLMALLLLALMATPFLFPGARSLAAASEICVFVVLAASYDVLLGYTGIVSFAQTMFFGIGAYGAAIPLARGWVGWDALAVGALCAVALSLVLAVVIGLLSLRVQAIFFSMITLAVASFAQLLATQLRDVTGGEDGLTFSLPSALTPGFRIMREPLWGVRLDGRLLTYYVVLAASVALFLLMLRIVNSPFGRVLKAIRENAFRAEALGYRTVVYRTLAGAVSAVIATLAGVLMALSLRYVGPDSVLSFSIMIDVLLMVVIGGMGTLYGPALGCVIIVMANHYLQPGMKTLSDAVAGTPVFPALVSPDRWLLWLGLLFVLTVYFFPAGVIGTLRARR